MLAVLLFLGADSVISPDIEESELNDGGAVIIQPYNIAKVMLAPSDTAAYRLTVLFFARFTTASKTNQIMTINMLKLYPQPILLSVKSPDGDFFLFYFLCFSSDPKYFFK